MAARAETLRGGGASEAAFAQAAIVYAKGSGSLRHLCFAFFSRFRYSDFTVTLVGGLDVAESNRDGFFHPDV